MIAIEVSGPKAYFPKPGIHGLEKGYECITPSAARGILESFYWNSNIQYVIDEIRVLEPIRFASDAVKETGKVVNLKILKNVRYLILAHYFLNGVKDENEGSVKTMAILKKRIMKKKPFKTPCLGYRKYTCNYRWISEEQLDDVNLQGISVNKDFDMMPYDVMYDTKNKAKCPVWYRPHMEKGVINLRNLTVMKNGEELVVNRVHPEE